GAYRVTSDRWTLSVRVGGDHPGEVPDGSARVVNAEASCALRGDGSVFGVSRWLVEARLGSSLRFRMGPRGRALLAREAGRTLPVLESAPGEWAIPFE